MNVLTRKVLNVTKSFIGNSIGANKFQVTGHYDNIGIQGGLVNNMRASLGNMLQVFEQIRCKTTLQRLHKMGLKDKKVKKSKNPFNGKPFAKGIILKTVIKKPKKPNSANRKCVIVKLSTGKEMTAYVPDATMEKGFWYSPRLFDVITEGLHADFYASALSTFTHAGHCLPIDHMTS
ncbi:uncharacterized protein LOC118448825 isoform X2 [Vespa mandarinia]|uniref:uncharacterized protein LOC118448825 isoform X2 n=1 Tax=Vespa mandarinia TaxID=7446 RepID=UPI0016164EEE|nr:uncharacterized protein LOC118448825 isoform X2 [Vespa mandarinia]